MIMIMILQILQALHNNEQNKVRRCCEETRFFRYDTRHTIAGKKFCATLNYCTRFQEKIHNTTVRLQWEDSVGRKMIEELFATSRSKFGHSFQSALLLKFTGRKPANLLNILTSFDSGSRYFKPTEIYNSVFTKQNHNA